jgi:hypothetical protein
MEVLSLSNQYHLDGVLFFFSLYLYHLLLNFIMSSTIPTTSSSLRSKSSSVSFEDLGLEPFIVESCTQLSIRVPTIIQQKCIPPILKGI